MPRYAARVDANQQEIVNALRQIGAKVQSLAPIGQGIPDLLVAFRGVWYLGEVKRPRNEQHTKSELTPQERDWHTAFESYAPIQIWHSVQEALAGIGAHDV